MAHTGIGQASSEWWRFISNSKFCLLAIWTIRRLRDQSFRVTLCLRPLRRGIRRIMMFVLRRMRIRSLDLYKAFRAYGLIATSGFIQIRRVVNEAYRAFCRIFIQKCLHSLSIHIWILRQLYFPWDHICLRWRF
jgi:hypothetical protein